MMSEILPVIPLHDMTLFPGAVLPVVIGNRSTLAVFESAKEGDWLAVFAQRDPDGRDPRTGDLFEVGTAARLVSVNPGPHQGTRLALIEGEHRIRLLRIIRNKAYLEALVEPMSDGAPLDAIEAEAMAANVRELMGELVKATASMPDEFLPVLSVIDDPGALCDLIAAALPKLAIEQRQQLLEAVDLGDRLELLAELLIELRRERQLIEQLRADAEARLDQRKRETVLREQMNTIREKLGEMDESGEIAGLRERLEEAGLPPDIKTESDRELARLERIPEASPVHSVTRDRLEWFADLPWAISSATEIDVAAAAEILERDHHGLAPVKERILEYLAVLQLKRELRGPSLCFVGPPGVGKTSLGRSIAEATGREFVRMSLGGCGDEAEIRGHRRTYVGALPGQIIQGLRRAGTNDPVMMLDELDKLGRDFRGDPAAALLEVLDPRENHSFRDRYLDVPFDLSRVLFIATANHLDPIPAPLRDRLEIIELPGYISDEKRVIAERFLLPRQAAEHGLQLGEHLRMTPDAIDELVERYTREAGVRRLEQQLASICRKRARAVVSGAPGGADVTPETIREMLGPPRYHVESELEQRTRRPGVAVALAWTPAGGELLFIEATRMPRRSEELRITGHVKKVMEESAYAALSWLRANAGRFGIPEREFADYDIHIHVPAAATPKDGPSAGVVMAMALLSLFVGQPIRPRIALTGELTLSGHVLPVSGLKAKVVGAHRCGVREIVAPAANRADIEDEVPAELRAELVFHYIESIDEAIIPVFGRRPRITRSMGSISGPRRARRHQADPRAHR